MPGDAPWMTFQLSSGAVAINKPQQEDPDVLGYDMAAPTVEDAERVAARIQSVYDSLPPGEKLALEMLLRQAAGP